MKVKNFHLSNISWKSKLKTSKFGRHRLGLIVFFFNAFYMWGCHVKEIRADAHTTDHPLPQIHGSNSKQFRQNNCWGMLSCWSLTRPPNISLLIFEFTLETQILVTWLGQWATCDDRPPLITTLLFLIQCAPIVLFLYIRRLGGFEPWHMPNWFLWPPPHLSPSIVRLLFFS